MPNAAPRVTLDTLKQELARDYQAQVTNYFMGDKERAMKFMSAVIHSVRTVPKLIECDKTSLLQAFMTCAEFRLYPSNASGEAYVLPYKGKAQFQLGYQGIITLAYRSDVDSLSAHIVYKNDIFEYEEGLNPRLIHKPDPFKDRGEAIGAYAVASVKGQKIFKVMSKDEILKFKEMSQAKGSQYSPWNAGNDPELWMWKKTVLKQLGKTLPKNSEMHRAIAADNVGDSSKQQPHFDTEGVGAGRALHDPNLSTGKADDKN